MASPIINFLRSEGTDHKGRKLIHLQSLEDEQLERSHDVIQWLFPSDLPSDHFRGAPILTEEDIKTMSSDLVVQGSLQMSLTRMVWFYENNNWWITMHNHNFKRLTRILRCLWLAGLKHDYVSLQKALDDVYIENCDIVGERVYMFWKHANDKEWLLNPPSFSQAIAMPVRRPPNVSPNGRELPEGVDPSEWFDYI